jgi:hypothetical protein
MIFGRLLQERKHSLDAGLINNNTKECHAHTGQLSGIGLKVRLPKRNWISLL